MRVPIFPRVPKTSACARGRSRLHAIGEVEVDPYGVLAELFSCTTPVAQGPRKERVSGFLWSVAVCLAWGKVEGCSRGEVGAGAGACAPHCGAQGGKARALHAPRWVEDRPCRHWVR